MTLWMMIILSITYSILPICHASVIDRIAEHATHRYPIAAVTTMSSSLTSLPSITTAAKAKQSIDLNQANIMLLRQLKGIGPKKAQAILDYRTEHGRFKSLEELKSIKGIGDKMFKQLRKNLMVISQ